MPDTCTFVLRASEGPCVRCGWDRGDYPHTAAVRGMEFSGHLYLGPSLGVCGEVADVHGHPLAQGTLIYDHAFTTEQESVSA